MTEWSVEDIPDADLLFKRVHRSLFKKDNTIMSGAFQAQEMSTDWAKYSSPLEARARGRSPSDNAVIQLHVGSVRELAGQQVEHSPIPENRAHANVVGTKGTKIRILLRRMSQVALPLEHT